MMLSIRFRTIKKEMRFISDTLVYYHKLHHLNKEIQYYIVIEKMVFKMTESKTHPSIIFY